MISGFLIIVNFASNGKIVFGLSLIVASKFTGSVPNIFLSTYFTDYELLQTRVKSALERGYKDFLKHDWLEEGLCFSLMENYTDLSWAKMVNKPMVREKEPMEGMDDILKVPRAGVVCVKILIEGEYMICLHVNYISC